MLTGIVAPALRTLSRHRLYTAINLVGLALGIAVFLTMTLIVRYEERYGLVTVLCRSEVIMPLLLRKREG
ncbi:hypothetical protein OQ252_12020 [Acetobacter farinalis]|uniref:Uncharacterized protein n=1 Tax=Acetobacter farinalis TaxID=1260984 RepID=A0ABT3Q9Z6_9PROT|nr:hypothetical protein [Acetobacter farinalis]MCX2562116.1 hypothetical protein [Acetobacter farinalis]NHO30763.1 hypothetical protein [Acetobacter farinalis]